MIPAQPLWSVLQETDLRFEETDQTVGTLLSVSKDKGIVRYSDLFPDRAIRAENHDRYKFVKSGSIVLNKMSASSGAVGVAKEAGIVSPDYAVLETKSFNNERFINYILGSADFCKNKVGPILRGIGTGDATSVRTPRVGMSEYLSLSIPVPPFETQRRIADYLDRETAEIDAAVADLDKYVELLEKRRTLRLIEETRIRSSARMTTIGRHAQVSLGKTLQPEQKSQNEQLVNYVRAGNIQPNGVFDGEAKQMWMTPDEQSAYSLLPGDVLVVEGGAGFGRSLTLNLGLQGWGFQNHVIRIRPQSGWIGKFIDYSIRAHKTDGLIDLLAVGATIPGFSADKARNLPIAFLTEREQSEVVQTLDKDMDEIDSLIAESTRLRDLLLKRRSVLITEVVTGRKQV